MTKSHNPDDETLKELLTRIKTIAVVGLSADPSKASHNVAKYLREHGYRIIPVNPTVEKVLDEKSYPDLKSIPEPVDVVDVFRRPEYIPEIADHAIAIGAKVLWLQLGITHDEAAHRAAQAGLVVIQDMCMQQEHARLLGREEPIGILAERAVEERHSQPIIG